MASHIALTLPHPLPLPLKLKRPRSVQDNDSSGMQQEYEIFQSEKDTLAYLIRLEVCHKYRICSVKYYQYFCNYFINRGSNSNSGAGRLFKQFQKDVHAFQMIIKSICEFPSHKFTLQSIPNLNLFIGIEPTEEVLKLEYFGMKKM
jgi:hypothetical protein